LGEHGRYARGKEASMARTICLRTLAMAALLGSVGAVIGTVRTTIGM
jgi:hypothetical protein